MRNIFLLFLMAICFRFSVKAQITYAGTQPGKATAAITNGKITLENDVLKMVFSGGSGLHLVSFEDKMAKSVITLPAKSPLFTLTLVKGKMVTSNNFELFEKPGVVDISEDPANVKLSLRSGGKSIVALFIDKKTGLTIIWQAELRDGSNYVKQHFTFKPKDSIVISKIMLVNFPSSVTMKKIGVVDGSPMVHNNMFFAVEHPMSQVNLNSTSSTAFIIRSLPLNSINPFVISSVWGVTPNKQLRRGFLYYVERERANPYHQFLHYNSWFDLSYEDRVLTDSLCLDRVKAWGDSLITKRNTSMDAFLFDDGWDDYKTLWQFNKGFPDGFTNVGTAAKNFNAGIGVWMSPWGGYDVRKPQRLEYGAKQNPPFETNENGFSLAGPVYFKRFSDVTSEFINKYNVSIFKFDGVGAGNGVKGVNGKFERDVDAFLKLTRQIRSLKPDIYLSLTIGTWPSVYWLNYGDAIWRAGDDTGMRGKGTKRQQWINYRDAQAYQNVVKRAPLYPLSALMYHGLIIADAGMPGELEMDNKQIEDEMWSFFSTGTSLEEMYVNPHKLNSESWDNLSTVVKWTRENATEMPDVHWVGGDPAKEEVYGFAAWSDKGAYVTLRNPSAQSKTFKIVTAVVFDLPPGSNRVLDFYDARMKKEGSDNSSFATGETIYVKLKPFEIKVFN
ncbi:MAG: hypothetical protein ABI415_10170, partial [Flavitalea sp.]